MAETLGIPSTVAIFHWWSSLHVPSLDHKMGIWLGFLSKPNGGQDATI